MPVTKLIKPAHCDDCSLWLGKYVEETIKVRQRMIRTLNEGMHIYDHSQQVRTTNASEREGLGD